MTEYKIQDTLLQVTNIVYESSFRICNALLMTGELLRYLRKELTQVDEDSGGLVKILELIVRRPFHQTSIAFIARGINISDRSQPSPSFHWKVS